MKIPMKSARAGRRPTHSPKKPADHRLDPTPPSGGFQITDLCKTLESYLGADEVAQVHRAYLFGAQAHEGQRRRSGEHYIYHHLEVAHLLLAIHMDSKGIID